LKNISSRRLTYVQARRTDKWISDQTGIPRSTIGFIRRGDRKASTDNIKLIRNLFQRESYKNMRYEGMTVKAATRFKWYAPESVQLKESIIKMTVNKLTTGITAQDMWEMDGTGIGYNKTELWYKNREEVKDSLKKSKEIFEEIAQY